MATKKELALKMLTNKNGAKIERIAEKLEITTKGANGLIYFLRRDGHNIQALGGGVFQVGAQKQKRRVA